MPLGVIVFAFFFKTENSCVMGQFYTAWLQSDCMELYGFGMERLSLHRDLVATLTYSKLLLYI